MMMMMLMVTVIMIMITSWFVDSLSVCYVYSRVLCLSVSEWVYGCVCVFVYRIKWDKNPRKILNVLKFVSDVILDGNSSSSSSLAPFLLLRRLCERKVWCVRLQCWSVLFCCFSFSFYFLFKFLFLCRVQAIWVGYLTLFVMCVCQQPCICVYAVDDIQWLFIVEKSTKLLCETVCGLCCGVCV